MNTKDREAERAAIVAEGLTDAQRRSVMYAKHDGDLWLANAPWEMSDVLFRLGITGQDGWTDALTPFGLAVRDYLRGEQ